MKPCLLALAQHSVSVLAGSLESATEYARNYCGDYRTDYRNHNKVEFSHMDEFTEEQQIYVFSIEKK